MSMRRKINKPRYSTPRGWLGGLGESGTLPCVDRVICLINNQTRMNRLIKAPALTYKTGVCARNGMYDRPDEI